jgi:hypothetical protein
MALPARCTYPASQEEELGTDTANDCDVRGLQVPSFAQSEPSRRKIGAGTASVVEAEGGSVVAAAPSSEEKLLFLLSPFKRALKSWRGGASTIFSGGLQATLRELITLPLPVADLDKRRSSSNDST